MKPISLARLAAAPALGCALVATGLPALAADPVAAIPASGQFVLDGRGFGHGRGMSQWGAYGAADAGLSWSQILDFYYPGATQTGRGNPDIRVWISRDSDRVTELPAQPGLTATVGRRTYSLPSGSGATAWRALQRGSVVVLQYRDAKGTWRDRRIPRGNHVVFGTSGDTVAVTMPGSRIEEFPGRVMTVLQGGRALTVVSTTMERYLRGVVPSEMPASWHKEALAAQSVAARTYASSYRARKRAAGSVWDICDTVTCQVYKGTATSRASGEGRVVLDDARATAAIAATSGTVLKTSGGNFVHAEFSASNGGYTVDGGAYAQVAKPDPYDGRMRDAAWSKAVSSKTLDTTFSLGGLKTVQVLERDGLGVMGGRVRTVRLVGGARTVDISGAKMRQVLGLRSDWFEVQPTGVTMPGARSAAGRFDPPSRASVRPARGAGVTALTVPWSSTRYSDRLDVRGGRLLMARGLGGGHYVKTVAVSGAPGSLSRVVGVADVDGDRRVDVVAIDRTNRLWVLRGNGKGAVAKAVPLGRGWGAFSRLELRDTDGDRRADIVGTYPDGRRTLYLGTAKAGFIGKGTYTGR